MNYRTKEEQAADFLREGILAGRFPRGSRLKQAEIAQMLQLSITPVREALKLLAAEGYVCGSAHRGLTVSTFSAGASSEILDLRVLLETYLMKRTFERVASKDIEALQALEGLFDESVQRGDRAQARGLNYRFHRALYDIAQAPDALHFVQILWARYPFDLINSLEGRTQRAADEHQVLLEKLVHRDLSGLLLATRDHIESGWRELEASLAATQKR